MKKREILEIELNESEKLAQDAAQKVAMFCQSQGLVFVGVIGRPHEDNINVLVTTSGECDPTARLFALGTALEELEEQLARED